MTLLSICQQVAREVGVDVPTEVVGSVGENAVRLLAVAQTEGQALARGSRDFGRHDWSVLQKEHTITTVASQAEYALPSDWSRGIDNTAWDRSNYWEMRGSLRPQEWQFRKSAIIATGVNRKTFRVKQSASSLVKAIFVDPTPTAVETLVIEYISTSWCQSSGGAGQSLWAADTDTGVLDEYLMQLGIMWRFLERVGLPYLEARDQYDNQVGLAIAADTPLTRIQLGRTNVVGFPNIQDATFPDS